MPVVTQFIVDARLSDFFLLVGIYVVCKIGHSCSAFYFVLFSKGLLFLLLPASLLTEDLLMVINGQ